MKLQLTTNLPTSMPTSRQLNCSTVWWAFAIAIALASFACAAHAQTFQVIHYFTGGQDGAGPSGALTIDRGGHIFGTAGSGGVGNNGTVFELRHSGALWIFNPLHHFKV